MSDKLSSQRVVWLLEELGVDYELVVHLRDPKTFLAPESLKEILGGFGKAPTLVTEDGKVLVETSAIMMYLLKKYDTKQDFSALDDEAALRDEMLTSFALSTMQPWNLVKMICDMGALIDKTEGKMYAGRAKNSLDFLDKELEGREYFMGDRPGRADFMLSWPLDSIAQRRLVPELPANIAKYRDRVSARPAWMRAIEKAGIKYDLNELGKKE